MVCLGNICRSPLAKAILMAKFEEMGIEGVVDSAGFEPYHIGDKADERAQEVARQNGLDISSHRARLFRKEDFDNFDRIYVMDSSNYRDVKYMARNEEDRNKIDYILNALEKGNKEVPDPYYGGIYQFREVFALLTKACTKIAENLKK